MKKEKTKPVEPLEEEIRILHVFPDYIKNMPYECKSMERLHFIVKGYADINEIREVPINGDKIIWKHTFGNGEFRGNRNLKTGNYTGNSIDYITPNKEILIFISACYLGLMDATWIKVIKK
jgi:hypothetical protein